jgi:hypothetical protein
MPDCLTDEQRRRLQAIDRDEPDRVLSFIVSLQPSADWNDIAAAGMAVTQYIPPARLLLGTMTAAQALAIARRPDVALVELDTGGVYPLGEPR